MTPAARLWAALVARGARLWTQGGKVCFQAPSEALDELDLALIRAQKPALIQLLAESAYPYPDFPCPGCGRGTVRASHPDGHVCVECGDIAYRWPDAPCPHCGRLANRRPAPGGQRCMACGRIIEEAAP